MPSPPGLAVERIRLPGDPPIDVVLAGAGEPRGAGWAAHPVILMIGDLDPGAPPAWSLGLLAEGYALCAFTARRPPHPDPARRPEWLVFDERFAHSYPASAALAVGDTARVIDWLSGRADVDSARIGWLGSSSTGIPGCAVACHEPRLAALVAFVATGAYRLWLDSWHTHGLWCGASPARWPETEELLGRIDPIAHVAGLWPTAVLLVSGGADHVVDHRTADAFVDAARPFYVADPDRLRHVVYHGVGHNLPPDVVAVHAEHWFRTYMSPDRPPPPPPAPAADLAESTARTAINATGHDRIVAGD